MKEEIGEIMKEGTEMRQFIQEHQKEDGDKKKIDEKKRICSQLFLIIILTII
jgi:hypothetical protein